MAAQPNKALFLDRDGVINVDKGYLWQIEDIEFIDGIFDLCRAAKAQGYVLIVVTNQSGIGRGYYSEADFGLLMDWMKECFRKEGCPLDEIYVCPHHPTEAQGEYLKICECRKPKPGMLLAAQTTWQIDMAQSVMIGDKLSDMQAGQAAGVGKCLLLTDQKNADWPTTINALSDVRLVS